MNYRRKLQDLWHPKKREVAAFQVFAQHHKWQQITKHQISPQTQLPKLIQTSMQTPTQHSFDSHAITHFLARILSTFLLLHPTHPHFQEKTSFSFTPSSPSLSFLQNLYPFIHRQPAKPHFLPSLQTHFFALPSL